ncbi:acyl carrier protein [Pradoshia eiseniae]|uniref:Acyl carrier protein n=1 Tax=Pradoshia eiseniae TaxID=2064768 RepID=A0A2S7N5C4_9BACI|nr:phosphopantetheine-binding protein [Pradoshia eiseniae]PQD97175.1 acyl carrier protein [Pradoshia eiseniae]
MSLEQLRLLLADYLDDEEWRNLEDKDDLTDCGMDSIAFMSITEELRSQDIMVTFMDLAEETTVEAWHRKIQEKTTAQ